MKKALFFILCMNVLGAFSMQGSSEKDSIFRHIRLKNGFTFYLRKNDSESKKIYTQLTVKAGFYNEDKNQLGLSHLIEHLAFKSTKNYPDDKIKKVFDSAGLRSGADWNAETSERYTSYFVNFSSGDNKLFSTFLNILLDWSSNVVFLDEIVNSEKKVVVAEGRLDETNTLSKRRDSVQSILIDHPRYPENYRAMLFQSTMRGDILEMESFYNEWYKPDLMAITIVGDINLDSVENTIRHLFKDVKSRELPMRGIDSEIDLINKPRNTQRLLTLVNTKAEDVWVKIYQTNQVKVSDANTSNGIRNKLLVEMTNSLLSKRFLEIAENHPNKDVVNLNSSISRDAIVYYSHSSDKQVLVTNFRVINKKLVNENILFVLSELRRIAKHGFLASEFKEAFDFIQSKYRIENKTIPNKTYALYYQNWFLGDTLAPLPKDRSKVISELLRLIDLKEINSFIKSWIVAYQNMDVIIEAPSSKNFGELMSITEWLNKIKKLRIGKYEQPQIKKIELNNIIFQEQNNETKVSSRDLNNFNLREVVFDNGLRLIFQNIKTNEKLIKIKGVRAGGLSLYTKSDYHNALKVNLVTNKFLTQNDNWSIKRFLQKKGISLSFHMDQTTSRFSGAYNQEELHSFLNLLHEQMSSPVINLQNIDTGKRKVSSERFYKSADNAKDVVQSLLYERNEIIRPEDFTSKLDGNRILDIYNEHFSSPSGYTFILTGDFDEEYTIKAFENFCNYYSDNKTLSIKGNDKPFRFRTKIDTTLKVQEQIGSYVELYYPNEFVYSLKNDVMLDLLYELINVKLFHRLRNVEGGIYELTGGCLKRGLLEKNQFSFNISFDCAAEDIERLVTACDSEINKLKDGIDEEIFGSVKNLYKGRKMKQINNSSSLSNYVLNQVGNGLPIDDILTQLGIIEILTIQDMNLAASKFISTENRSLFKIIPNKK